MVEVYSSLGEVWRITGSLRKCREIHDEIRAQHRLIQNRLNLYPHALIGTVTKIEDEKANQAAQKLTFGKKMLLFQPDPNDHKSFQLELRGFHDTEMTTNRENRPVAGTSSFIIKGEHVFSWCETREGILFFNLRATCPYGLMKFHVNVEDLDKLQGPIKNFLQQPARGTSEIELRKMQVKKQREEHLIKLQNSRARFAGSNPRQIISSSPFGNSRRSTGQSLSPHNGDSDSGVNAGTPGSAS